MGSYKTFMHYVREKKEKKKHIGVIRPKFRVKNEISRFLKFLRSSTCTSRLALLDLTPDSSSCSEHISDPKEPNGKFMYSTPPFWDLSRESWGARSEPLPSAKLWRCGRSFSVFRLQGSPAAAASRAGPTRSGARASRCSCR